MKWKVYGKLKSGVKHVDDKFIHHLWFEKNEKPRTYEMADAERKQLEHGFYADRVIYFLGIL